METYILTLEYQADAPMFPEYGIWLSEDIVGPLKTVLEDIIKRGFATLADSDATPQGDQVGE